jgi:hypothetical protein
MNCLTCGKEVDQSNNIIENKIKIDLNCYPILIYTDEKVIFNISELGTEETQKHALIMEKQLYKDNMNV